MYKNKSKKAIELLEKGAKKNATTFEKLFTGNPYALVKSLHIFFQGLKSVHDMIFWDKVERFLRNMELTPNEKLSLRKLFAEPNKEENMKRLLQYIDNIEAEQTIDFLSKATKAFIHGDIPNRETYFRVCYVLDHTIYEDLNFLREHINEKNIEYSLAVQGLLSTGLMYISFANRDEGNQYSFTPLAELVLKNAIEYEDKAENIRKVENPTTKLELPEDEDVTDEEIEALFKS